MNTLPTKKPGDPDVNTIPTWRELAERFPEAADAPRGAGAGI